MKRAIAIVAGVIAFAACASAQSSGEYWVDPKTGEWIKILQTRSIRVIPTTFPDRFMLIGQTATDAPFLANPVEVREIVLRCGADQYGYSQYEVKFNPVRYWADFGQCAFDRCLTKYGSRATGDLDHSIEFGIDKDPSWKMRVDWREGYSVYFLTQEREGKSEKVDAGFCREHRELPQSPAPVPVRQSADTTKALRAEIKVVAPETREKAAVITVTGHFERGDNLRFFDTIEKIHSATVYLDSMGGIAFAGVGIGEIIRDRGFRTAVLNNGKCFSACAIAWLGGAKRYLGEGAQVGFHHPFLAKVTDTAATKQVLEYTLGIINSYVVSTLGLNRETAEYVIARSATPLMGVNYLTLEDGEKYGIDYVQMPITEYAPLP